MPPTMFSTASSGPPNAVSVVASAIYGPARTAATAGDAIATPHRMHCRYWPPAFSPTARSGQPVVASIVVHLQDAVEVLEFTRRDRRKRERRSSFSSHQQLRSGGGG